MWSEDGFHEFGIFPLKKEIVKPFPSMFCILVLQQKLGPKSLSFENINIGSNLYLNLTCNPHILGRAGIIATPRLVVTAARCLVSAWCSVVSSASCRFDVLTLFTAFLCLHFHFSLSLSLTWFLCLISTLRQTCWRWATPTGAATWGWWWRRCGCPNLKLIISKRII